jgi:hypothetical protein
MSAMTARRAFGAKLAAVAPEINDCGESAVMILFCSNR